MIGACGRSPLAALSFLFLCGLAFAGGNDTVVISLSGAGSMPAGAVDDEELVAVDAAGLPRLFLNDQTLALYLGDLNGDGLMDEPNDIDALEIEPVPAGVPQIAGVHFSLISDQAGLKDGDILRFDPSNPAGGLTVVFSEPFLLTAVASNDGNIDIDAFAFMPDGSLLFSMAEDESTGPQNVIVEDDSILLLPAGATVASVLYPAIQVETIAQAAMGSTSAITDVKGLEYVNGDILFTVQSPSSHDATIFSMSGGGTVYQGLSESALGFTNAVEADALALFDGQPYPCLDLDFIQAKEGDVLTAGISGLTPNQPFLILVSGVAAPAGSSIVAPGFGVLALETLDALFLVGLQNAPALAGVSDGAGTGTFIHMAPYFGGVPYDVAMQVLDAGSGKLSNPILLEVNQ